MAKQLRVASAATVAGNVVTSFTPNAGGSMTVLYGHVKLTTDATAANRRVVVSVFDPLSTSIFDTHSGATVPASQTDQHHEIMQGIFRETSFVGGALQVPMPKDFVIPNGYSLRVTIEAGVAGDSYTCYFVVDETD